MTDKDTNAVKMVPIGDIEIVGLRRAINPDTVQEIAESIKKLGLQSPISVTEVDGAISLVAGLHRLHAARLLGWTEIPCTLIDWGFSSMWQISENLHRADLTALERAEHVAEWIVLIEANKPEVSGQDDQKLPGRPEGGKSKAARELTALGPTEEGRRKVIERVINIAAISPDGKEAAKAAGPDGDQNALLEIANEPTPDAQVAKTKELNSKRKNAPNRKKRAKSEKTKSVNGAAEPLINRHFV
jgi:ParB-like chromosome segregation protein Spo0J